MSEKASPEGAAAAHWQAVYESKDAAQLSWYRPQLDQSLRWFDACTRSPQAHIVDMGGGASTFVDHLLDRGYTMITVVDLAQAALDQAAARLGARAAHVQWRVGEATAPHFEAESVDFWHDRAVLHFLIEPEARERYAAQLRRVLKPGGDVLIANFAPDGPQKCSGLPVLRAAPEEIAALLGPDFELIETAREHHFTPWQTEQRFVYTWLRKRAEPSRRGTDQV